ncbi:MAG: nitroreductase family deazaflavin-dependent oxidoreductase [Actinomycetota bacterium]
MSFKHTMTDIGMKTMTGAHRAIRTVSGGRWGNTVSSMPVVELHTVGRKSGKPRTTMLSAPIIDDGTYVIVASKGGDDRDPDWYRNLVAEPNVALTVDGTKADFTAHVADDAEKAELWPRIVEAYDGYGKYQERTDREIPVVVCEPA